MCPCQIDAFCFTVMKELRYLREEIRDCRRQHQQTQYLLRKLANKEIVTAEDFEDNGVARLLPLTSEKEVIQFNLKMDEDQGLLKNLVRKYMYTYPY